MDEKLSGPREKRLQAVTKHESRYLFGSLRKISFYNSICRQANPLNCLRNKASGVESRNKRFENCFRGLTKTIFSQAPKFSAFLNCTLQSHGSLFYVTELWIFSGFGMFLEIGLVELSDCRCDLVIASDIAKELVVCLLVCSTTSIPLQSFFRPLNSLFSVHSRESDCFVYSKSSQWSFRMQIHIPSSLLSGKPTKIIEVVFCRTFINNWSDYCMCALFTSKFSLQKLLSPSWQKWEFFWL